ncbi:hypothetical protein EDD86DRAFT_203918 [Gorgonomyces haynaldii]|nr:hypothetical protein EDD86DRAFT_203918 [Gorgonomyces haynaldii]
MNGTIFEPSKQLLCSGNHQKQLLLRDLDYFQVFVSPASGPRFLASAGFSQQFVQLYESNQIHGEKWFIGGSTGALRHVALIASLVNGQDMVAKLRDCYVGMDYKEGDTPLVLHPMMENTFRTILPKHMVDQVIDHPQLRLGIVVCRIYDPLSWMPSSILLGSLLAFYLGNFFHPAILGLLCEKIVFYTGDKPPTFIDPSHHVRYERLTSDNIYQVMHATTCIPSISFPCNYIHGIGRGLFVDGGVRHYYLSFKLNVPSLLISDQERYYATAFDAQLPFYRRSDRLFENTSVLRPSKEFLDKISHLPAVKDWFKKEYIRNPDLRRKHWLWTFTLARRTFKDPILHWHKSRK